MLKKFRFFILLSLIFILNLARADQNVLNVYIWYGEIPDRVIAQFEKETGIKVNYATYDDNETMYAKLRASKNAGYDIIEPSSYYVQRMAREGMLEKLDKTKLPLYGNLDPDFAHPSYDPNGQYSLPYMWGITGIFINDQYYDPKSITSWSQLWDKKYYNRISLLDDPREVFSIALLTLGYSVNDQNPQHLEQAYERIKLLLPNIKMFNSDAIPSIFIDEDSTLGMAWNGDIFKAQQENSHLNFVFPKEGFVIWTDNLAIPKNAPHLANAYKFLNFMLRGDVSEQATLDYGYATANSASRKLLPASIRNNPIIFPPEDVMKRGQFQADVSDNALAIMAKYWELLKIEA